MEAGCAESSYTVGEKATERKCIAIDLKSFYASVECVDRGLDPLSARLVVADESRTDKTICLAVTPALKAYGIGGRARLFEVRQKLQEIWRRTGEKVDFIIAPPRMRRYMEVSSRIYDIYLRHVAAEDIFPYSIDEIFADVTGYLSSYKCTAHELAMRMIRDVLARTGITATAGIGTNLFLAKVAMDIEAKHSPADKDGVRIAELDEMTFRQKYWNHRPLTDFWRIGPGIASRLESNSMFTLGDVALCSVRSEEILYKLFGVNAELLIDHAWGWEPCTVGDIKRYKAPVKSISSGQVLSCAYDFAKAGVIVREMADALSLELVSKHLVCDQIVLTVCYDIENLTDSRRRDSYHGPVETDRYGRQVPKSSHGSINLPRQTSSGAVISKAAASLFDKITDKDLLVRRIYLVANNTVDESKASAVQLSLFDENQQEEDSRERRRQEAVLEIKRKFGKNAILKGLNFEEGATMKERNLQVGGHKG